MAKGFAKAFGGWCFLIVVGGLYGLTAQFDPAVFAEALSSVESLVIQVLPILLLVFGLLFLASWSDTWERPVGLAAGRLRWSAGSCPPVRSMPGIRSWENSRKRA